MLLTVGAASPDVGRTLTRQAEAVVTAGYQSTTARPQFEPRSADTLRTMTFLERVRHLHSPSARRGAGSDRCPPRAWPEAVQRIAARAFGPALVAVLLAGCSAPGLVLTAAGVATDTSMTWDIVKHVHAQLTEGDPVPCVRLDPVQRALNPRCGAYLAASIGTGDLQRGRLQGCVLSAAVRDPRVWPALPDLLRQGARSTDCERPPLVELAALAACPDFGAAAPEVRAAFAALADSDARNVQHDVVRLLSCPGAVAVGLDRVLDGWLARGALDRDRVGFGALGALHPRHLVSPLGQALERRGHTAADGLGAFVGAQPGGFELALRSGQWDALEWWIARVPGVVDQVPPAQGGQLPWVPLARVLTANFLVNPALQAGTVEFLVARGADPRRKLPYDAGRSVLEQARASKSPHLARLEAPALPIVAATPTPVSASVSISAGRNAADPAPAGGSGE